MLGHSSLYALLSFLALAASPLQVRALKEVLSTSNDVRSTYLISSFGYLNRGALEITVDDLNLMVPSEYKVPSDFKVAFFLQRATSDEAMRGVSPTTYNEANTATASGNDLNKENRCFHEEVGPDDIVIKLGQRSNWKHMERKFVLEKPGLYNLYFSNCERGTNSGFKLTLSQFNEDGGVRSYLSVGQSQLPTVFFMVSAMFLGHLIAWCAVLVKQKTHVKSIHWLMLALVVVKVFMMFTEGWKYYFLNTTGATNAWNVLFYIFSFLKGILLFTIIILIGTGWSYIKPFLTDRDKQLVLVVLVVQLMINIAMVVLDETPSGTANLLGWRDALHVMDMLCCCFIFLPIIWSIKHLKGASGADGKTLTNFSRLKNFRTFYLCVVSYVYFTRIVVYLLSATLTYDLSYCSIVFTESAAFLFYASTGYLFRPREENPYLALGKDYEDADDTEAHEALAMQQMEEQDDL